jgi:hypothetical protein
MIALLSLFLHILVSPFKTQARLEAEISVLRHQLNVLRRQAPSKPRLTIGDRVIFVWGTVTLAEFTPKRRPLRFMVL